MPVKRRKNAAKPLNKAELKKKSKTKGKIKETQSEPQKHRHLYTRRVR